jgi:hypothetical protein
MHVLKARLDLVGGGKNAICFPLHITGVASPLSQQRPHSPADLQPLPKRYQRFAQNSHRSRSPPAGRRR